MGWEFEDENSLATGQGQLKVDQDIRLRVTNGHEWCLPCVGAAWVTLIIMTSTPTSISYGSPFTDCMAGQAERQRVDGRQTQTRSIITRFCDFKWHMKPF